MYALSVSQVPGEHITFEQLLLEISPDVLGATSIIGTFRLPLRGDSANTTPLHLG